MTIEEYFKASRHYTRDLAEMMVTKKYEKKYVHNGSLCTAFEKTIESLIWTNTRKYNIINMKKLFVYDKDTDTIYYTENINPTIWKTDVKGLIFLVHEYFTVADKYDWLSNITMKALFLEYFIKSGDIPLADEEFLSKILMQQMIK